MEAIDGLLPGTSLPHQLWRSCNGSNHVENEL